MNSLTTILESIALTITPQGPPPQIWWSIYIFIVSPFMGFIIIRISDILVPIFQSFMMISIYDYIAMTTI